MQDFINWATTEWSEPTNEEKQRADEIWSSRCFLDAGVFVGLDNPSRRRIVLALIRRMQAEGATPTTNEAALAQAWRDPSKQVPMAMLIKATTVHPCGDSRAIGRRCAAAGTNDVVDASLALLADQLGTSILTTNPNDMALLGVAFEEL